MIRCVISHGSGRSQPNRGFSLLDSHINAVSTGRRGPAWRRWTTSPATRVRSILPRKECCISSRPGSSREFQDRFNHPRRRSCHNRPSRVTCVRQLTYVLCNKPLAAECALLQLLKNELMLQLSVWEKVIGVEYVWTSSLVAQACSHAFKHASEQPAINTETSRV